MKLLRIASLFTLVATFTTTEAAQGDWTLEAAAQAIIWDEKYDLGLGGQLGVIRGLSERTDLSVAFQYGYYTPQIPDVNQTVTSYGGLVTYFFAPEIEGFTPKLGVHVGYSTFSSPTVPNAFTEGDTERRHYFQFGGEGQLVFDVGENLKFFTMMSPSYLIGPNPGFTFRIGLGLQYRVAP